MKLGEEGFELGDIFGIFEKFQQILETINSTLNPEEIERKAVRVIYEHIRCSSFMFLVHDFNSKKFIFACQKDIDIKTAELLLSEAVARKDKIFSQFEVYFKLLGEEGTFYAISLSYKKKPLAVFIAPLPILESLTVPDKEFLKIIGLAVLYATTNATLYNLTKKLAVWDNKTNLYNYRYFLTRLSNEIARAKRYGRKLSLVAIDLDDFKKINDELGHLTADRILKDIGRLIRNSIRVVDIPSRFGGDEFFILLPETDLKGAKVVATRIKNLIEEQLFPLNSQKNRVRINLTYGLAEYIDGMTARDFMEAADKSLLKQKKTKKEEHE
jgi:diguanylate cyclase (GGDEF)-like protein